MKEMDYLFLYAQKHGARLLEFALILYGSQKKKDIKLLNYYSLTEADFKIISEIGVKNGFLTKIISYKHTYYDDRIGAMNLRQLGIEYHSRTNEKEEQSA